MLSRQSFTAAKYRVTVISHLAGGGDSFSVLIDGAERLGGMTDTEALAAYLARNSPVFPPLDRITVVP